MSENMTYQELKALKPKDTTYSKATGHEGLSVSVHPSGFIGFVYRYRIHRKRETMRLGSYPDMKLSAAVKARDKAAALVADKISPLAEERKKTAEAKAMTFEKYALDTYVKEGLCSIREQDHPRIESVLRNDVIPHIGKIPLKNLTRLDIRRTVMAKANGNPEKKIKPCPASALRLAGLIARVLEDAIDDEKLDENVALLVTKKSLKKNIKVNGSRKRHMKNRELRRFMPELYKDGSRSRALEVHLLLLTMLRKRELATLLWTDIGLEAKEIVIPAERMKDSGDGKEDQTVYLSTQAVAILEELKELSIDSPYVFPAERDSNKPVSSFRINRAINRTFERIDGEQRHFTPHDLRRTAATLLADKEVRGEVIELCLHHTLGGVAGVYNLSARNDQRREAMQILGDLVDVALGSNVVPIGARVVA